MNISFIGIILSLAILMLLVYKRVNIIIASIITSLVVILTSGIPAIDTITGEYVNGFAGFIIKNLLLFVFSSIFGKLMDDSGAASAFAQWLYNISGKEFAPFTAMIATALLAYGGVSNFVIVFAVYPIFLRVWREVDLPPRLIPGAIFGSSATFAASMLPGTPQLNNIMPIPYLNTTPTAAWQIGLVTAIVSIILIYLYFRWEFKKARDKNEGFHTNEAIEAQLARIDSKKAVNPYLSMLPMIALLVTLNIFGWNILVSLVFSIILVLVFFWNNIQDKLGAINEGTTSAASAIFNTSGVVGFGSVVKLTSGFKYLVDSLMGMGGNPMISLGIIATLISGITGSGTGGIAITMDAFTDQYLKLGVNPEIFHRIVTIASNGLDSLPHNGLVITVITACGMTHKESYKQIFVTSVAVTLISLAIAIVMGIFMYPIGV